MKKISMPILRSFIAACAITAVSAASAAGSESVTAVISKQCSGECITFTADSSEYNVKILFTASETVSDFSFTSVEMKDFVNGRPVFDTAPLMSLKTLDPEKPLLVTMTFFGDLPSYGITYTDRKGKQHNYTVEMSGKDGSVVLNPF